MANGHGGYRRPTNPAPVSGPGALSRRTDGRQPTRQLPNAKYGEAQAFEQAQQAAPMSGDLGMMVPQSGEIPPGPDLSGIVPFGEPTMRPNEPIEAGMSGGLGPGPSIGEHIPMDPDRAKRLRSYLPALVVMASMPDADPNTKQLVRQLRAELG